jgi:hypothetical protein
MPGTQQAWPWRMRLASALPPLRLEAHAKVRRQGGRFRCAGARRSVRRQLAVGLPRRAPRRHLPPLTGQRPCGCRREGGAQRPHSTILGETVQNGCSVVSAARCATELARILGDSPKSKLTRIRAPSAAPYRTPWAQPCRRRALRAPAGARAAQSRRSISPPDPQHGGRPCARAPAR